MTPWRNITATAFGAFGLLALAGCGGGTREVVHEQTTHEVVHEQPVIVEDPHRAWWETYHHDQTYDRDSALASHRMWCDEHPADSSCEGWYHRN